MNNKKGRPEPCDPQHREHEGSDCGRIAAPFSPQSGFKKQNPSCIFDTVGRKLIIPSNQSIGPTFPLKN